MQNLGDELWSNPVRQNEIFEAWGCDAESLSLKKLKHFKDLLIWRVALAIGKVQRVNCLYERGSCDEIFKILKKISKEIWKFPKNFGELRSIELKRKSTGSSSTLDTPEYVCTRMNEIIR